jgi:hypothetical protein
MLKLSAKDIGYVRIYTVLRNVSKYLYMMYSYSVVLPINSNFTYHTFAKGTIMYSAKVNVSYEL